MQLLDYFTELCGGFLCRSPFFGYFCISKMEDMIGKRPLILVSNDDGIQAGGIHSLIRFVRGFGEVVVMAPDAPRSGASCSISPRLPVDYQLVKREPGLAVYKCNGSPVDCVKLAKQEVLERKPDLVIGGINHGSNASVNVHYSGTMGIAIEGAICGIPSVGFSIDDHSPSATFDHCEEVVKRIVKSALEEGFPEGTCLNVNIPGKGPVEGIRVCRQARGSWTQEWDKCMRPNGYTYFWLAGYLENKELDAEDSDLWAMNNQYAAVTPVTVDRTAYDFMSILKDRIGD